jgi:hypothetical protein
MKLTRRNFSAMLAFAGLAGPVASRADDVRMPVTGDVVWYWVFPNTGEIDPKQPCAGIVSLVKGPRLINVGVVTQQSLWHPHEDILFRQPSDPRPVGVTFCEFRPRPE